MIWATRFRKLSHVDLLAVQIPVLYCIAGICWIILNFQITSHFIDDPAMRLRTQTYAGWLLVIFTAWLLYIIIYRAILDSRKTLEMLKAKEEFFRALIEHTSDLTVTINAAQEVTYISPSIGKLLGYQAEDLLRHNMLEILAPEDADKAVTNLKVALNQPGVPNVSEYRLRSKAGEWLVFEVIGKGIQEPSGEKYAVINARDITERKLNEEQIKTSLKEKEVLLKEVHHRVKNNLQVIRSLFNLQASYIKDKEALAMFEDCQVRIKAMSLIHEKLYQSKDLSSIDFFEYVNSLVQNLIQAYAPNRHITPIIRVNNVVFGLDTAIPCGLIIYELVSNALKHAFPADGAGEISISLEQSHPDSQFTLTVKDNGVGLPEAINIQGAKSLGLVLVNALKEQLGASLSVKRDQGTEFTVSFSLAKGLN